MQSITLQKTKARYVPGFRCSFDDEGGLSPAFSKPSAIVGIPSYKSIDGPLPRFTNKKSPFCHLHLTSFASSLSWCPLPDLPHTCRRQANDRSRALALYEWNLALSAAFIVPLQVCEVAVRNGVAEAIQKVHGAAWPWSNGFLRSLPRPRHRALYNPEQDLRRVAAVQRTVGKVIAEVKFAFWEQLFTVGQESRIWNVHFRACFPGAPATLTVAQARMTAHNDLAAIRGLRNRIAHHEPIFTRNILDEYRRIHAMISWRSKVAAAWMDRKQGVTALVHLRP